MPPPFFKSFSHRSATPATLLRSQLPLHALGLGVCVKFSTIFCMCTRVSSCKDKPVLRLGVVQGAVAGSSFCEGREQRRVSVQAGDINGFDVSAASEERQKERTVRTGESREGRSWEGGGGGGGGSVR